MPASEPRTVSYIRSADLGLSWSKEYDIHEHYNLYNGASNIRIKVGNNKEVYLTWTEWKSDGNGLRIYFAGSLNSGNDWENPIILSETGDEEYERDWTNLILLNSDSMAAVWEGGRRAFRQIQYSKDGGVTWSEPSEILYGLVGENGYAEFAHDSNGVIHMFVAQRVDADNPNNFYPEGLGLWHTTLEGNQTWRRADLASGLNNMSNISVVIHLGNQVVAAWYSTNDFNLVVQTGEVLNTPRIGAIPQKSVTPIPNNYHSTLEAQPIMTTTHQTLPEPTKAKLDVEPQAASPTLKPIGVGIVVSLFCLSPILIFKLLRRNKY